MAIVVLRALLVASLVILACLTVVEGCTETTCLNGGTCVKDVLFGFTFCLCPSTHTGLNCEQENPCTNNPCQNGGSCDVSYYTYDPYCVCQDGWSGNTCDNEVTTTSCADSTCHNGGTCYHLSGNSFCDCAPGFAGSECENIDPCNTTICPDSHICIDVFGQGSCICIAGFTGQECETNANENCGTANPCKNGGTCDDLSTVGFKVCICALGYEGQYCGNEITTSLPCNELNTPCANGGTCTRFGVNYYCHCTHEFYGDNCTDSVHLMQCLDFCENGGSCYIDRSVPRCICQYGWEGRHCSISTTQAVFRCTQSKCGDYGECRRDARGDQHCKCQSGWYGDYCDDKDDAPSNAPANLIGALIGGSVGFVLLLIVLSVILLLIKVSRSRNNRDRQQSHSQAAVPGLSMVYDPRFVPDPSQLPAKDLYSSDKQYASNIPRRYTQVPLPNRSGGKAPTAIRNSATAFAHGAAPPARKISRSSVPHEGHANEGYETSHPPTVTGPPPSYSSGAPSVSASAEHTYQSISEYGDA